jgi:hypothetical protein
MKDYRYLLDDEDYNDLDRTPYDSISNRDPIQTRHDTDMGRSPASSNSLQDVLSNIQALQSSNSHQDMNFQDHSLSDLNHMYNHFNLGIPNSQIKKDDLKPETPSMKVKNRIKKKFNPLASKAPVTPPQINHNSDIQIPEQNLAQMTVPESNPESISGPSDEFLPKLIAANRSANLAQSISPAALGFQAPKPNDALFNNLAHQNAGYLQYQQGQNALSSRIKSAIAQQNANKDIKNQQFRNNIDVAKIRSNRPITGVTSEQRERMINQADQRLGLTKDRLSNIVDTSGNNLFSKSTAPYTQSLDSANRLEDVLKKIKSGDLIGSSNVAASINNDMAQLLTGSKSTAVSDRQHAEIQALESTWNKIKGFASSKPTDVIPKVYLDQYENELNILKESLKDAFKRKTDELKSGTSIPSKSNIYQKRFESQMNSQPKGISQESISPGNPSAPTKTIIEDGKIKLLRKAPDGMWDEVLP